MFLYLIQHAKAKSEQEDPSRSLSEEGYKDIKKTALFMSRLHLDIEMILHSSKLRAKQTAEILADILKIKNCTETKGVAPLDEPEIVADMIRDINKSIVIVGHLPHLSKLASLLLCGDKNRKIVSFKMGGVVCLQKEEDSWLLKWMINPDIIFEE